MVARYKVLGIALIALGGALAAYGLLEVVRILNSPCAVASWCPSPELALYTLCLSGALVVVLGIMVLANPRKRARWPGAG